MEAILMAIKDKSTPTVQVDTWEDLIALGDRRDKSQAHSNQSQGFAALTGGANVIVKAIQWHR